MTKRLIHLLLAFTLGLLVATSSWAGNTRVLIKTSLGEVELELADDKAPNSVKNFLRYTDEGFYNGTIFHRVIYDFMIQGGGFDQSMKQKRPHAPIKNEAKNGLKNDKGTIAMARTSAPHSATAQFFINHKNNDFLNYPSRDGWGYAVFGKVTKGMDVVEKIAEVETGRHLTGMQNVPNKPVIIESISRISE